MFGIGNKKKQFPIPVVIFSKRADGQVIGHDRGKILKEKTAEGDLYSLELMTRKVKTKPIPIEKVSTNNEIGLIEKDRGNYAPIDVNWETQTIIPVSDDDRQYTIYNHYRANQMYPVKAEQLQKLMMYAAIIIIPLILTICGVILYDNMSKATAANTANNERITDKWINVTQTMQSITQNLEIITKIEKGYYTPLTPGNNNATQNYTW